MKDATARKIQSLLLQWFKKNKRPLLWRKTRDPYPIWISEMMLQQTQVNTVIPYYERWMKIFPNVSKLAQAPLSRVLKCWEGLGYYQRARNLHRAARIVVRKWGGEFPNSREKLEILPGIGRYTAGAIASIAFNQPEPILDGNVIRILSRIFALNRPVDQTEGKNELWKISRKLVQSVPRRSVGDFNQSLMELGALVCLPENPKCPICPLGKICKAHQLKKEIEFPFKARKQRMERLNTIAAVIWKNGKILLERQPLHARWGGLWMFPQWIHPNGKDDAEFLKEKVKQDFGLEIRCVRPKQEIEHGFTKYHVRLRVYEGETSSVIASPAKGGEAIPTRRLLRRPNGLLAMTRWTEPHKVSRLPLPRPHQKIAQRIQDSA